MFIRGGTDAGKQLLAVDSLTGGFRGSQFGTGF